MEGLPSRHAMMGPASSRDLNLELFSDSCASAISASLQGRLGPCLDMLFSLEEKGTLR